MKKIIIYKTISQKLEQIPVVEIFLDDKSEVSFSGDQTIILNLKKSGIPSRVDSSMVIFPMDGELFFESVPLYFDSDYLCAGDILNC